MTEAFDWQRALARLKFANPEDAMREIAAYLHRHGSLQGGDGCVDPSVLSLLAQMIDPDEAKPITGVKLELRRLKRKAPPKEPNYELRRFIDSYVDANGDLPRGVAEGLATEASERFGVSRSHFHRELEVIRKYRRSQAEMERFMAQIRR